VKFVLDGLFGAIIGGVAYQAFGFSVWWWLSVIGLSVIKDVRAHVTQREAMRPAEVPFQ
jgi:hypothetical protein